MPKDIQERMRALIAQHGSALAALTALRQQPEAQQNDMWYIERFCKYSL